MKDVIEMNENPKFIKRLVERINADQAFKEFDARAKKLMAETGWIIHYVIGQGSHTHGLKENFSAKDIEIMLFIDPNLSQALLWDAFRLLETGIEAGKRYSGLIKDLDVLFIESPKNKDVLRMILPDPKGELEQSKMEAPYNSQFE